MSTTSPYTEIPEGFIPKPNQLAIISDGYTNFFGSFTGRRCTDGSWEVFYKDYCGDNSWSSTSRMSVKLLIENHQ